MRKLFKRIDTKILFKKAYEHKYLSLGSRSLCSNDRYGIVFILITFFK